MKITFVMPGYSLKPVGGIKVVYEYANQLAARGHEVTVLHSHRLHVCRTQKTCLGWAVANLIRKNKGLTVVPNVNLVSNIGFRPDAVHTTDTTSRFGNLPTESLVFPLTHPKTITPNKAADRYDSPIRGEPTIIGIMILRIISRMLTKKMRKALGSILLRGRVG